MGMCLIVLLIASSIAIAGTTDPKLDKTLLENKTDFTKLLKDSKDVKLDKVVADKIIADTVLDYNAKSDVKIDVTKITITKQVKINGIIFTYMNINGQDYTKISTN